MISDHLLKSTDVFYVVVVAVTVFFVRYYLYRTDTAYIKNLASIPGWPLFGSLVQLGETHAKTFGDWSKRYGPVFQVRLGNKVNNLLVIKGLLVLEC